MNQLSHCYLNQVFNHQITKYEDAQRTTQTFCVGLHEKKKKASSWLTVVPTMELDLHLDPSEFCVAIRWWLGVDISRGLSCPLCTDIALDPLGHHAATCRQGGDVISPP